MDTKEAIVTRSIIGDHNQIVDFGDRYNLPISQGGEFYLTAPTDFVPKRAIQPPLHCKAVMAPIVR
nr:hypothetical protein [Pseudanabaena sp. PCC 6802]